MWAVVLSAAVLLAGCATVPVYSEGPFKQRDKDTEYHVADRTGGFLLTIKYSRYQFFPETSAVESTCRSALTSLAHEIAEQRGRKAREVEVQRIRIATARNPWTAITSCTAQVPVDYQ